MSPVITIRPARTSDELDDVRRLCWEYRDYLLGFDASMKNIVDVFYPVDAYTALMQDLAGKHARPRGEILLAKRDEHSVGCAMMHALNDQDVEIKRVFVQAQARGTGAGAQLSQALIEQARSDGAKRILLDTNASFTGARRLYEKLGFTQRGPYSEIPEVALPMLVFYELKL
ncbi:N-acetyltransferase [Roseobacter denitrificans]|uniref:Acetyltransferase, putative n=1 Tax=Roseobacter denitrificans (strain ATCC 33942 / OCh 114) TaxID=375451 RepID=Q164E2_ROSDO|nr:GNAT family N-acetyltransferase [Roseobacter denitrificans]ABG32651.1 acetyltransferase, putative [Roseobacter denitrificans OCh 114]AVL52086.1 N-acetyltransferase [Roseobacter denitrificans]SFF93264.1 Acetyltransferase (GNAT) family protein [Roseobacter denitrificans OCh 114]